MLFLKKKQFSLSLDSQISPQNSYCQYLTAKMGPNFGVKINLLNLNCSRSSWRKKISTRINNYFNPTPVNGHLSCATECTNFRLDYELSRLWIRIVILTLTTTALGIKRASNKKKMKQWMIIMIMIMIIIVINTFRYKTKNCCHEVVMI